jgi:hypothetical protein
MSIFKVTGHTEGWTSEPIKVAIVARSASLAVKQYKATVGEVVTNVDYLGKANRDAEEGTRIYLA